MSELETEVSIKVRIGKKVSMMVRIWDRSIQGGQDMLYGKEVSMVVGIGDRSIHGGGDGDRDI